MIALLYIPIAVALGWFNAHLVNTWVDWSKGREIKHFWNGVVHGIGAGVVYIIYSHGKHFTVDLLVVKFVVYTKGLLSALAVLSIARIFFNTAYNYFHLPRQPIDYVSSEPESIVDKVEQRLFKKDGITPLILYIFITIVLILA